MSSFFVKFYYNQSVKKVKISRDQLTWDNVCSILTEAFFLAEKNKIRLKYKDCEDDEVTVSSDEDLEAAFNVYFMKNLIKFFVHYSGVFDKNSSLQSSGYSKIERPRSFTGDFQTIRGVTYMRKVSDNTIDHSAKQLLDSGNDSIIDKKPRVSNLKLNPQELQNIFSEVFSTTEVLKKIQDKLSNYIKQENNSSADMVEYTIDTDYKVITDYMMTTLTNLVNHKLDKKNEEEEEKTESRRNTLTDASQRSLLQTGNLAESIYESCEQTQVKSSWRHPPQSEFNPNSTFTASRSLASTMGVKLMIKYENGKARFVSVPERDEGVEKKKKQEKVEQEKEYEKIENKEDKLEESIYNVTLSMKKTVSVEKKRPEFSNQILKSNHHDLDQDLPAPYQANKDKNIEKDLSESLYEKIE